MTMMATTALLLIMGASAFVPSFNRLPTMIIKRNQRLMSLQKGQNESNIEMNKAAELDIDGGVYTRSRDNDEEFPESNPFLQMLKDAEKEVERKVKEEKHRKNQNKEEKGKKHPSDVKLEQIKKEYEKIEARFSQFVNLQVDDILEEDKPGSQALVSLLRCAQPSFARRDLKDLNKRKTAFRSLRSVVHPDSQESDAEGATKRFQEIKIFYDKCCAVLEREYKLAKRGRSMLPPEFYVGDKWEFLNDYGNHPVLPDNARVNASAYSRTIGYKCFNMRAAIAHGKRTEIYYSYQDNVLGNDTIEKVSELFERDGGGFVELESVAEIKREIMEGGPVVSTSFNLTKGFLTACEYSTFLETNLVNQLHPVVLVGWGMSPFGEVWLARPGRGEGNIPIAIGQFGVDTMVLAPDKDFVQEPWQDDSKAFDTDFVGETDWYDWSRIEMAVQSDELEKLSTILDVGFAQALNNPVPFVVRDRAKKARSRWATLTDVDWVVGRKQWKVSADFIEG